MRRTATLKLARFDTPDGHAEVSTRGVPVRRIGNTLCCTVFDLMLAQYGVHRPGLPGTWPTGWDDPSEPYTPAWQESITGVSASQVVRVAQEFAHNAEESGGRSMIIMGAGICQWFHGDATYRAILAMLILTGSMGRNGGGWAHYVGQEKCRPITGWATMAGATDWVRPPRQMIGTAYWYTHTDQWRYDGYRADALSTPLGRGRFAGKHTMDVLAASVAMGWMPFFPQFDRSSLDVADEADAAGTPVPQYVAQQLASGGLRLAVTEPDDPKNWPRVLTAWRANLLGSSSKGNEYFLQHLLGTTRTNLRATPTIPELRPNDIAWSDDIPEGKLDLMLSIDFRMTSTTLLSDIVLPAATWYEKNDLSSTDMHPFVHAFSPAIDPPWEARSDFDAFHTIARVFSRLAKTHLGVRRDVVMMPMQHDTPGETTYPSGTENDWRTTGEIPVPGKTMANIAVVTRNYPALAEQWESLGPAGRHPGPDHQGHHRVPRCRGQGPRSQTRRDESRGRRGPARDRHRDQDVRHGAHPVRHHQRTARNGGLQTAGTPHRPPVDPPVRGQRGETNHLRGLPSQAGSGDHQPRMVRQRNRRPPICPVHGQRRGTQTLAHADRAYALLPRSRLDRGTRRATARLPAAAGHGRPIR